MMTEDRFFEILEAYGANPERWPEAERAAAQAYAEAHADTVTEALQSAAALDALLAPTVVEPSDLLQRRLLKALPVPAEHRPQWQIPVAAAAALVVGALIGFTGGAVTVDDTVSASDAIYAEAYGGLDQDWIDWLGEDV